MSKSPQPWLSYRRQCQQTLHPTSAHSDCEQSLQPIDWQGQPAACLPGGSGPKDVYTSGGFMGHVVHLPPIPQHPRTPGHKAFRSQLTAGFNEGHIAPYTDIEFQLVKYQTYIIMKSQVKSLQLIFEETITLLTKIKHAKQMALKKYLTTG